MEIIWNFLSFHFLPSYLFICWLETVFKRILRIASSPRKVVQGLAATNAFNFSISLTISFSISFNLKISFPPRKSERERKISRRKVGKKINGRAMADVQNKVLLPFYYCFIFISLNFSYLINNFNNYFLINIHFSALFYFSFFSPLLLCTPFISIFFPTFPLPFRFVMFISLCASVF